MVLTKQVAYAPEQIQINHTTGKPEFMVHVNVNTHGVDQGAFTMRQELQNPMNILKFENDRTTGEADQKGKEDDKDWGVEEIKEIKTYSMDMAFKETGGFGIF